jgi:hypothetical protein
MPDDQDPHGAARLQLGVAGLEVGEQAREHRLREHRVRTDEAPAARKLRAEEDAPRRLRSAIEAELTIETLGAALAPA